MSSLGSEISARVIMVSSRSNMEAICFSVLNQGLKRQLGVSMSQSRTDIAARGINVIPKVRYGNCMFHCRI